MLRSLLLERFQTIFKDFRAGLGYHYPICCILRFCFDTLIGRLPAFERAKQYRIPIRFDDTGGYSFATEYIPCGLFHKPKAIKHEYPKWLKGRIGEDSFIEVPKNLRCMDLKDWEITWVRLE